MESNENCFQILPDELIFKVFEFLEEDLQIVGQVCKTWNEMAALEYYNRGIQTMETYGNRAAALKYFTSAIKIQPFKQPPYLVYLQISIAHYYEENIPKATEFAEKVTKLFD
jgi:hypothetical protein